MARHDLNQKVKDLIRLRADLELRIRQSEEVLRNVDEFLADCQRRQQERLKLDQGIKPGAMELPEATHQKEHEANE